jgi:hypothetical protein
MSITVLCNGGNVEIIVDGAVVHSVPFATPKLLAAYKGDTLDRLVREASQKVIDSDEFQGTLCAVRNAWMETQPHNPYEQRFLAIMEAAGGYAYADRYTNSIMASVCGGTITNIRPSMRGMKLSTSTGGRSQQQIVDAIKAVSGFHLY